MRSWSILGGLIAAAAVFAATWQAGLTDAQSWTAAVTMLCAVWWISESIPLAATALVPLAVFPLTGVLKEAGVAAAYCDPLVLLFMGGFMMAKAAERWGAHRRIAQAMIAAGGQHQRPADRAGLHAGHGLCEHVDLEHRGRADDAPGGAGRAGARYVGQARTCR